VRAKKGKNNLNNGGIAFILGCPSRAQSGVRWCLDP
jgi:hypothetical protein